MLEDLKYESAARSHCRNRKLSIISLKGVGWYLVRRLGGLHVLQEEQICECPKLRQDD
jgi:hypothetical protein